MRGLSRRIMEQAEALRDATPLCPPLWRIIPPPLTRQARGSRRRGPFRPNSD